MRKKRRMKLNLFRRSKTILRLSRVSTCICLNGKSKLESLRSSLSRLGAMPKELESYSRLKCWIDKELKFLQLSLKKPLICSMINFKKTKFTFFQMERSI